jgi:2'-5' RNA ligase
VRLFIAINFPDDIRSALHAATEPVRVVAPAVRWTEPARLHLTLKFLGEVPEAGVDPVVEAIRTVGPRYDPVDLELGGLGAFPNLRRPRIVWLGMRADPKLELIHHDLEVACAGLGYDIDGRAFRPHVTLGRAGDRRVDARALATAARGVRYRQPTVAASVDLMVSEPAPAGPRYRLLAAVPLGRRGVSR